MSNNWKTYKLEDIASFSYGKMPKKKLLGKGKYPTFSGYKYQYQYPEFNVLKDDLIVVARGVGGTGDVKLVKEKSYLTNLSIKIELDQSILTNRYFYYKFLLNNLKYLDSGSAQSQLTINDLSKVEVKIPPLPEQKAIANILSAIDGKIENNLTINKTLEDMAMALYKHWFVDFGPFQDGEFIDSELGPIPKGWEVKRLDDLADILNSKRIPLSTRERSTRKGKFPYYGASGIIDFVDDYLFDGEYVIISEDGENLRSRKTPIAFSAVGKFWVNNHAHIVRGKMRGINKLLISHMAQLDMNPFLTGAVQPKLNKQNLLSIGISFPEDVSIIEELLDEFHSYSSKQISNELENQSLTQLRDTLLPKLISGEVRLKEFKEQIESVL
ncbi:restriction endonuclease subunit S [Seonamhaeicola algicola]|nr:restriction endonuclease subunit S [Seonamhaeicola algicola]